MNIEEAGAEKKHKRTPFPSTFWVANTMEIFERMAWYGFFAVSSLYFTSAISEGGLGFTSEQRGTLQGVIIFILYLLPVLTGALADRFGYKKTFLIAYLVLVPTYFLMGKLKSYEAFTFAFLMMAVGAAIFKPLVVGTVARVTDKSNSSMGFGIFYMMVNVGGMIGPMIAGYVRAWSWDYVFVASSACIAVNIIVLLLFYQEPTTEATSTQRRTVKKVLNDMMDVMGNWRFFTTIFVILILMMCASNEWLSWRLVGISALIWLAFNFAIDIPLKNTKNKFHIPPMKIGNWRFALYLLILSGFWASFEQIFITMPEYIRDYVDTKDMLTGTFGGFFNTLANIDPNVIAGILQNRIHDLGIMMTPDELNKLVQDLLAARVRVEPEQVKLLIERTITIGQTVSQDQFLEMAKQLIVMGKQVNPEYIINFDAAAIVVFQVLVSYIIARWNPFSAMVSGIMVASIGIGVSAFIHSGWPIALAIVVFGFGEMMASPKSQEYIGRIAPREQTGMYMGYYFWAVALGNLFGGILSGQGYGKLARDLHRPDLMWLSFGVLGILSALSMVFYNQFVIKGKRSKGINQKF